MDFLFEIGLEEVLARMIAGAQAELQKRVVGMLERERLLTSHVSGGEAAADMGHPGVGDPGVAVKSFSTPRRLAVWVSSDRGPASAQELIELARDRKLELKALSVQSTSLDDVFLHYTGHGLAEMEEA